jgi:type VI secretion system protein ImpF
VAEPLRDAALRGSFLDRLIKGETGTSRVSHDYVGVRELRASVARDLEWLLNTKAWTPAQLDEFPEGKASILTYGIPDFSTFSWRSAGDAAQISRTIEEAIRRFESRLLPQSVRVDVLPGGKVDDFRLRFRIEATLAVDPIREAVSFDTDINFDSTSVNVSGVE